MNAPTSSPQVLHVVRRVSSATADRVGDGGTAPNYPTVVPSLISCPTLSAVRCMHLFTWYVFIEQEETPAGKPTGKAETNGRIEKNICNFQNSAHKNKVGCILFHF